MWPVVVAAAALLLTAPQAFAGRAASARPGLLTSLALEQAPATVEALAPAYVPQGFELHATADPHPRQLTLFPGLEPPLASAAAEKLASGVASWEPRPNLQRIQKFVAETWWVREHLGPVDSPNLYQAFGLDPQNNTDPLGLAEFLKPTTTSVDATYTTCIKTRPQGDVSVPCVATPGGKVTVQGFTLSEDTPDYLRALHRIEVPDEDAAAMVARNAPDSVPIAGTALGAAAQGAAQAGTVAKPAFHLTMAFVQFAGPGMLASTWTAPVNYLNGLGEAGSVAFRVARQASLGNASAPVSGGAATSASQPLSATSQPTWMTHDFLKEVARRAEQKIGGSGAVAGTEKHAWAAKLIERYQSRYGLVGQGLSTEQSYLGGVHLGRSINLSGSVRLDVVEGSVANPAAVFDFKFTLNPNPLLSTARVSQIQTQAGLAPSVPITVVHP